MRFNDYFNRLSEDDKEYVIKTLDKEEERLRKFLAQFDENELNGIAIEMNDTGILDAPELDTIDFIVELYKCQKAEFLCENVGEFIDDIRMFVEEEFN